MTELKQMVKKMCVIGEAAVGKTSLIKRYVYNKFDDRYIVTVGTKTTAKEIQINMDDGLVNLKLQIWDILGLRSFAKLQRTAYRGANGAFIVVDITRKRTLLTFENWLVSLYKEAGEIPVVMLGNKNDLKAKFGRGEIERFVNDYDIPYYLTSARTGENVNDAFYSIGKLMVKPWAANKNIVSLLKKSTQLDGETEPEMEPERQLSIFEVEDIIMARYCDLLEDQDIAMATIRKQFERADLNFMSPSVKGLKKLTDYLLEVASNHVEPTRLEKERKAYKSLIKMIE